MIDLPHAITVAGFAIAGAIANQRKDAIFWPIFCFLACILNSLP